MTLSSGLSKAIVAVLFFFALLAHGDNGSGSTTAHTTVGTLKIGDKLVQIFSGEHGPVYTVKTPDGEILAEHLSRQALSRQFPELGKIVERGVADDASLYPHDPAPTNVNGLNNGL